MCIRDRRVSGAKNAALPCMAAALLTDEPVILENIPQVRDIQTTRNLLAAMGAEVELGYGRAHHRTTIHCRVRDVYKRQVCTRSIVGACPKRHLNLTVSLRVTP